MPAEIEAAISELDIIENVRVIGVPSDFYGEKVAAFFVFDEFPMLGSGKIDSVTLKQEALNRLSKEQEKKQ